MSQHRRYAMFFSPLAVLAFGILCVSTASIMIRFIQKDAPALVISFYRLGIADLVLAPIALTRYRKEIISLSKKQILTLMLAGIFLAIHFAAWITSLQFTTIASSVVLVTTVPLWVAVVSPFILHERVPRMVVIGMITALLGGTLVGLSSTLIVINRGNQPFQISELFLGKAAYGNLLAIIGAWMAAGYILIGRGVRSKISLIPYTFIVYGTAAISLLVMVAITRENLTGYSSITFFWMIGLGLIPQLLGHSAFNWALRYLSAAYVSVALLGEPIGATILGWFFLREMPSFYEIIGGIILLTGIYLASRTGQKME